jgi:hypothetical protein
MKRVIEGISYNTATALPVARGEDRYPAQDPGSWVTSCDLYRTKGGKFFVTMITKFEPAVGASIDVDRMAWLKARGHQELVPLSYDEAYMFVLGAKQRVIGEHITEIMGVEVEVLHPGLFPSAELAPRLPRNIDESSPIGLGSWRPTKAAS